MDRQELRVEVSVDNKTGETMAVYFHIREGMSARTVVIAEGKANADYDEDGLLLGIELLAPCEVMVLNKIAEKESEPVRRFLRGAAPRELVPA